MSNFVNTKPVPIYRLGWCQEWEESSFFEKQYENIWYDLNTSHFNLCILFAQYVWINSSKVLNLNNFTNNKHFVLIEWEIDNFKRCVYKRNNYHLILQAHKIQFIVHSFSQWVYDITPYNKGSSNDFLDHTKHQKK